MNFVSDDWGFVISLDFFIASEKSFEHMTVIRDSIFS